MAGPSQDALVVSLERLEAPTASVSVQKARATPLPVAPTLRLGGVQSYRLEARGHSEVVTVDLDSRGLPGLAAAVREWLRGTFPEARRVHLRTAVPEAEAISWVDVLFPEASGLPLVWVSRPRSALAPTTPLTVRVPRHLGVDVDTLAQRLQRLEDRWGGVGGVGFALGPVHDGPPGTVWITPGGVAPALAESVVVRVHVGAAPTDADLGVAALVADVQVADATAAAAWIESLWMGLYADLRPLAPAVVGAHLWQRAQGTAPVLRLAVPEGWEALRVVRVPPWPGAAAWHQGWARLYPGRWEAEARRAVDARTTGGAVVVVGPPGSGKTSFVLAGLLGGDRYRGRDGSVSFTHIREPADFARAAERGRGSKGSHVALLEDAAGPDDPRLAELETRLLSLDTLATPVITGTQVPVGLGERVRPEVVHLTLPSRDDLLQAFRLPAERAGYRFEDGVLEAVIDEVMEGPPAERLQALSTRLRALWAQSDGFVFDTSVVAVAPERSAVAALDSDRPLEKGADPRKLDQLEFWSHIEAFTSLILSRATGLPLSIGLFGDWGSGKSFFMASLRLALEDRARAIRKAQPDPLHRTDWFGRIAPIRFNAWHYADADLWASLVHHLFKELGGWLAEEEAGVHDLSTKERRLAAEAARERLQLDMLEELRTTKKRLAAAKVARDAAVERLASAETRRRGAIRTGFLAAQHALDVLLADVAAERDATPASEAPPAPPGRAVPEGPLSDAERADVDALVGLVGEAESVRRVLGDRAPENLADVNTLIQQWSRGSVLLTFFGWLIRGPHMGARVVFFLSLVAFAYGLHSLVDFLRLQSTVCSVAEPPWYCGFAAPTAGWLVGLGSTASVAWAQFRQWLDRAAPGLAAALSDPVAFQARLDRFEGLKERLRRQNVAAQDERDHAESVVEAARRRLAETEQRVQEAQSGWELQRFVDQTSGDRYRAHLGLMATINEDLDQLADILADLERKRRTAARLAQDGAADDGEAFSPTPPPRIVLFIDDLDRCPPARVVEVLEAVHLLLAKDLFVVVVAVDARWLLRSVDTHFQSLVEDRKAQPEDPRVGPLRAATPRHYLEKIFQVPFQVPPMTDAGYERLVDRMMGEVFEPSAAPSLAPAGAVPSEGVEGTPADGPADPGSVPAEEPVIERPAPVDPPEPPADLPVDDPPPPPDDPLPPADRVRFTAEEQGVLHALGPIVQTPRAAKRLVNTARLVRLHAASEPDWSTLRVPTLLLLGLEVGAPEQWSALRKMVLSTGFLDPLAQLRAVSPVQAGLAAVLDRLHAASPLPTDADTWLRAMRLSERYAFILDGGHTQVDG